MTKPRIALTLGDPAGIGPELAMRLLADPDNLDKADICLLADMDEVHHAEEQAGVTALLAEEPTKGRATLLSDESLVAKKIPIGQVSEEAGTRAMHQLGRALTMARSGAIDAIVFPPLNKTSLHLAGMRQEDELRWFAEELCFEGATSELNVSDDLWTARVTSHVAIANVAERVTQQQVENVIELLNGVLLNAGFDSPRLGVAALNPHAGENGNFGREEINIIAPAIHAQRLSGIDVEGPFPSDTIFLMREQFDGIVTQYHDQGQIAMKLLGFDGGVTIEGGLPIFIATPAHGTAFDLVGQRSASLTSTQRAFDIALDVAANQASMT